MYLTMSPADQRYHEQQVQELCALRALVGTCVTALDRGDLPYAETLLRQAYEQQARAWDELKARLDAAVDAEVPETTDTREQIEAWLNEAPDAEECPGCADFGEVFEKETESWSPCPACRGDEIERAGDDLVDVVGVRVWTLESEMVGR